jgi:hypothetical protein
MGVMDMKMELEHIFHEKAKWHRQRARLPVEEKIAILVELQKLAVEVATVRGIKSGTVWMFPDEDAILSNSAASAIPVSHK